MNPSSEDRCILVLAPRGRDGMVIAGVLHAAGLDAKVCESLDDLVERLRSGAGLAFVTEEALAGPRLESLLQWQAQQPPWSDFPFVVLATRQPGRRPARALSVLESLGNVVLLERPLNADTLVSAARSALRVRTRQYEARSHLEEREKLLLAEREARQEAEQASRTKDEFLATLSHELRTPLSAILGWTHVLRQRSLPAHELARGVDTIERNARAQSRLIEELLDMSRIIAGSVRLDVQPVMPATVAEAVIASLQPAADAKSIHIERDFEHSVGPVMADPHRLQQILWNLMSNAIKFTPAGGTVRVVLERVDSNVEARIVDSGSGISPEFLPFVFDRFRQADASTTRSHGGLGLGLAIVRHLIELHGGAVRAASDGLGQGSTFAFSLPLSRRPWRVAAPVLPRASSANEPPPAVAAETADLSGLRVVLVDDDEDGRDLMARVLAERGAIVISAGTADEAVTAIGTHMPDLLISDIAMPRVDGYELIHRVRTLDNAEARRLPAIALTAFARAEDRTKALLAGYLVHIAKPVEPTEFVASVASVTGRTVRTAVP